MSTNTTILRLAMLPGSIKARPSGSRKSTPKKPFPYSLLNPTAHLSISRVFLLFMSYRTYPSAYLESGNSEYNHYIRNEVIKKWEENPAVQRTPSGLDYVIPITNPNQILVDITELFSSITNSTEGRTLSNQMTEAHNSFRTNIKQLYDVVDTLGEAHRQVANSLRQITSRHATRPDTLAGGDIQDAKKSLKDAERALAKVSNLIVKDAQKLEDISTGPRPPLKTFLGHFLHYQVGEGLTVTGGVTGVASQSVALHDQVHSLSSHISTTALGFAAALLALTAAVRYSCPDAKAYRLVEWTKTNQAMTAINSQVRRLMDLLGGLDLFWGKMRKDELVNVDLKDIADLRRIMHALDQHVDQCRILGNAISSAAKLGCPMRETSYIGAQQERGMVLPPIPVEDQPSVGDATVPTPQNSGHTYPPPVPPKH
ncbi:hypothetical protein FRC20_002404 [Serendipita sp. 405]|nr:hypothetical protein FRC15_001569 [Serendipita sp. 397]KAG8788699.1 hypothetical protein FRC16_001325 [Serendipita sp. 398]KAG8822374.1 hypothetical protein FRC18_011030 [Serendipita sp. 400]KAG8848992.1 hypothetical protein FRC20_002404 [Serendipita sp. 405]